MTKASAGYFFLRPAIQASHCVRLRQLSWAYLDCLGPRTTPSNQLPGSHVALVVKSRHLCSAACQAAPQTKRAQPLEPRRRELEHLLGTPAGGKAGAEAGGRRWGWGWRGRAWCGGGILESTWHRGDHWHGGDRRGEGERGREGEGGRWRRRTKGRRGEGGGGDDDANQVTRWLQPRATCAAEGRWALGAG